MDSWLSLRRWHPLLFGYILRISQRGVAELLALADERGLGVGLINCLLIWIYLRVSSGIITVSWLHIAAIRLPLRLHIILVRHWDVYCVASIRCSTWIHHIVLIWVKTIFDGLSPLISISGHTPRLIMGRTWKCEILLLYIVDRPWVTLSTLRKILGHLIAMLSYHTCSIEHLFTNGVVSWSWVHWILLAELTWSIFKTFVIFIIALTALKVQWRPWRISIIRVGHWGSNRLVVVIKGAYAGILSPGSSFTSNSNRDHILFHHHLLGKVSHRWSLFIIVFLSLEVSPIIACLFKLSDSLF